MPSLPARGSSSSSGGELRVQRPPVLDPGRGGRSPKDGARQGAPAVPVGRTALQRWVLTSRGPSPHWDPCQDELLARCSHRWLAGGASRGSPVRGRLDHCRPSLTVPRTSGTSCPGSTSTGEAGADGTRPICGSPDPSLALPTCLGTRRTGDGQTVTVPRHPPGMPENTQDPRTASERTGTRPVPGSPDPSLALPTCLGTRTGDGQTATVPHHPLGMTEKPTEDLRTALERAGTREQGGFQDGCPSWGYRGLSGRRYRRLRHIRRELTLVQRLPCRWPSRGKTPSFRSSPSLSGTSQPAAKGEARRPDAPQPLPSFKGGAQSREQTAQSPPAASRKVPEPPRPADTPEKSPAADPRAVTEAAEPELAAGAMPVETGAGQKPTDGRDQDSSALETEPAPPEESSAGPEEHLEVEPCSQSVPEAGAGGESHARGPTAAPEPAERVCATAGSAGDVGAELCPRSQGRQQLPSGAGEAEAGAARDGLLGDLQPPENSPVPPGATAEPEAQPSQACSDICAAPETSPGTQHPPGSGETEPAAGGQHQLCSTLPTPSLVSADLRSAAVLARKEEIELSYQQFSLTIAVVATMLLQKEPSMEAALGLALRANLRQGRIHHLQELEDFINSYDSATLSR
ncbi:translation initiation factor IF-2-like isoform X4 [Grus americana]|uniref:translation initiation factor IF-2-like isoform X4 n=1 Tax=Grus americana TaxID=9117 RepID=UPI002407BC91|nr:translation initiation factor IF-2-like isoform X4 [Grus americana]